MGRLLRGFLAVLSLGAVCVWGPLRAADGASGENASASAAAAEARGGESAGEAASSESQSDGKSAEDSDDRGGKKPSAEPSKIEETDTALQRIEQAIEVFRIETEKVGARGDGDSKGGGLLTAEWHGRIYEYIRNNAFDAVPHQIVQRGGDANVLRRNQFGLTVSGPVIVPKLYNGARSTFFTFSYEGTRERRGRSFLRTLPTARQRTGDFSDLVNKAGAPVTVYDPASTRANPAFDPSEPVSTENLEHLRDPFANNEIPSSRLDPVATAINERYPLPNTSVGPFLQNNYWTNPFEQNSPDGVLAKVDHNLFDRHKLTVDLAYSNGFQGQPRLYDTIGNPSDPDLSFVDQRLEVTETYAVSPNMVYEAQVEASSEKVETDGLSDERNLPGELGLAGLRGSVFPSIRFDGAFSGLGANNGAYRRNAWNTFETSHNLTLQKGKHSWTFSGQVTHYQLNTLELESPSGEFDFSAGLTGLPGVVNTGNPYASFLLGLAAEAEVTDQLQPTYLRRTGLEFAVRDQVEITPNLTATIRLDVDASTPRVEKYDRQSTVDLEAVNPANGDPGALVFASRDGQDRTFRPATVTLEPQIGFSWSPTAKRNTVVRGTFFHYYRDIPLQTGAFGTQGFSGIRSPLSPNRQLAPAVRLRAGVPEPETPLPHLTGDAANNADVDLIPQTGSLPRYNYWRFAFERRLPYNLTLRAATISYRGKNLLVGGNIVGLNRIPLEALRYQDALNEESFRRTLRPFPHYQDINTSGLYPGGRYLQDIGDFSIEKRAGEGLSFDFSYQIRKRWDDYSGPGVQNPFDRSTAWARSRNNRPHRWELTYRYELPMGPGKEILNSQGLLGRIFGEWSVSGFTRWMSGDPIVLRPQFNNTGGVVSALRVNAVPGVDPAVANPGPNLWFNPQAFEHPADFEIGDVARTHPTLRNPSWQNHDLAITKRVPITAEKSVELLFQGFNFINHANWNDPDSEIGPDEARNANAGKIIGSTGGRVLQLGMRYNF